MKLKSDKLAATAGASTDNQPADFLTVNQLLDRLPISRRTLANHRADGKIPEVRLGGRVLFHWPTVEAALLRRQREVV